LPSVLKATTENKDDFCNYTSSAGWLSWIVDVDRPSAEDTHTAGTNWHTCSVRTSHSSSLTWGLQTARTWIQSITLFGVPLTFHKIA